MKLIIEDDDGRKTVVPFARDEISIGRVDGNTIRLTERNVSRRHARLMRAKKNVFIEDLGSYNGVKVNGDRVQGRVEVQEGDLIEIGDYNLAIQLETIDALSADVDGPDSSEAREDAVSFSRQSVPTAPQQRPIAPPPRVPYSEQTTKTAKVPWEISEDTEQPTAPASEARVDKEEPPSPPKQSEVQAAAEKPTEQETTSKQETTDSETERVREEPDLISLDDPRMPSSREATAVIRIDPGSLKPTDERRPLSPGKRPRFVGLSGDYAGQTFEIEHTSVGIGRTEDNDITIDHRSMSRNHCRVYLDKDRKWKILDQGSANGIRVNGEDYSLTDLRRGDVVELGHVKIRFSDPDDPFVYTASSSQGETVRAQMPVEPMTRPAASPARKNNFPLILGAAGVFGALAVAAAFIFTGSEPTVEPEADESVPEIHWEVVDDVGEQLREAIQAAGDAAESEHWSDAIDAYRRALEIDPSSSTALQGLNRVEAEARAEEKLDAALAAAESGLWEEAWNLISAVPDDSLYAERAASHHDEIFDKYVASLVDDARAALRASQWNDSIESAEMVLALSPGDERASNLINRAERGRERAERARIAREERKQRLASAQKQRRPQKTSKVATQTGPSANELEAREAHMTGRAHLNNNEPREAIVHLERALRLDPQGQSAAHALLGTSYARIGDREQAAIHYRRFLQTNPNHRQAPDVRAILDEYASYRED